MGRMHSASKGRSGSSKPYIKETPEWVQYKASEVEALVAKLAKDGNTAAQIGIVLRDTYGIPSVKTVTGKTITSILEAKKLTKQLPQDMIDCIKTYIKVTKHVDENGQDRVAKRGVTLALSKINRLMKYYKQTGKIDADWKFDHKRAGMYVE